MKNIKQRNIISLTLNILMFIFVLYSVIYRFTPAGIGQVEEGFSIGGTNCLVFFTIQSNIFASIASLIIIPYNIKSLKNNKDEIPSWCLKLKYISVVAVTVTFVVVVVFLGPIKGYIRMYSGTRLFLHLLCPLISIISFCFFERGYVIPKNKIILGLIPVLIYGAIYLSSVIVLKIWPDFYNFNKNGLWYISFIIIFIGTYLFSYVISKIHNKYEINDK